MTNFLTNFRVDEMAFLWTIWTKTGVRGFAKSPLKQALFSVLEHNLQIVRIQLLSERPRVQIAPGTPKNAEKHWIFPSVLGVIFLHIR